MTAFRKDLLATVLTGLAVFAFAATHEGWDVPLIAANHRWAAGVILVLGMLTCGLGSPGRGPVRWLLATLGTAALVLAAVALVTGSLTPLSLLVAAFVALWVISTLRHVHVRQPPRRPVAT